MENQGQNITIKLSRNITMQAKVPKLQAKPVVDFGKKTATAITTILSILSTALIWAQLIRIYYKAFTEMDEFKQQMVEQLQLSLLLMVSLLSLMVIWQEYRQLDHDKSTSTRSATVSAEDISALYAMSTDEVNEIQGMPIVHLDKIPCSNLEDGDFEKIKITSDNNSTPIYIDSPENAKR